MFCHSGSQATTTEIFSYIICQSYWKLYNRQSEHECGTCVMVLRAVRHVLSNTYHNRWISTGGPTAWPPCSTPDLKPMDFYEYLWGHLKTLVYAAPVDNEETLHHRTVDACQTIRNCSGISERTQRSMMRRVEACVESHGGHFEHLL
jgi:hypothetical protein